MVYDIVEGTTAPLQFQMLENGSPIDLTGYQVFLRLFDRYGQVRGWSDTSLDPNSGLTIVDAVNGRIQWIPPRHTVNFPAAPANYFTLDSDLSPYTMRWLLFNEPLGYDSYVPSAARDVLNVYPW